jgi:hypothetical protein
MTTVASLLVSSVINGGQASYKRYNLSAGTVVTNVPNSGYYINAFYKDYWILGSSNQYINAGNTGLLYSYIAQDVSIPNTYTRPYIAYNSDANIITPNSVIGPYAGDVIDTGTYVFAEIRPGTTNGFVKLQGASVFNNPGSAMRYGWSVKLSQDREYLIVGAPDDLSLAGSVFILKRNAGTPPTYTLQQKLTAFDGVAGDNFGTSVSINSTGDKVIVGSPNDGSGSAYVYNRVGTTWTLDTKLTGSDITGSAKYGTFVDMDYSGNSVVVGAPFQTIGAETEAGKVYVYQYAGSWTEEKIVEIPPTANYNFGTVVRMSGSGTRIAILSAAAKVNGFSNSGLGYIYDYSNNSWTNSQVLVPLYAPLTTNTVIPIIKSFVMNKLGTLVFANQFGWRLDT